VRKGRESMDDTIPFYRIIEEMANFFKRLVIDILTTRKYSAQRSLQVDRLLIEIENQEDTKRLNKLGTRNVTEGSG
jgi:hypothetical protein